MGSASFKNCSRQEGDGDCRRLEIAYTHTQRTEEFRTQHGDDIFGSFTLKGRLASSEASF
jgi:hypothetical protein